MAIKTIKLSSTALRATVPVLAVLCVVFAYLFVKWYFANTISTRVLYKEIADFAVRLAPDDPQTHYASAVLHEKTFLPDDFRKSLAEYEQATALSPYDFRLWLELGKAREQNGDSDGAEKALRKALELAPNYSQVQWTLGNFLLRQQGKEEEAFTEIRKAAQGDKSFANPAIASAWQLFQKDTARIKAYVGDSDNLKAALALVLARENRFDEAAEVWNSVSEAAQRNDFKANGDEIYQKMVEARKYRAALRVFSTLADPQERKFTFGQITNGGFELETSKTPGVFEWQIADGVEPLIGVDNTQKRGGELSLKMIFNNKDGKAFRQIAQTVAVENRRYVFETFYKSELNTAATMKWEIIDAADGKVIAATEPVAANTDWTPLRAEFDVPAPTEAVTIRLARVTCPTTLCPITGKIWFDDFSLTSFRQ